MKMETQHNKICNTTKVVLRGKFIMINVYIKIIIKISNKPPSLYTSKNWETENK